MQLVLSWAMFDNKNVYVMIVKVMMMMMMAMFYGIPAYIIGLMSDRVERATNRQALPNELAVDRSEDIVSESFGVEMSTIRLKRIRELLT